MDELRRSWGEDIVSTNGTESLGKELDDMLAGEFEEATVNKWIDVSTGIFLGVDLLLLIEKFALFSPPRHTSRRRTRNSLSYCRWHS